MAHTLEERAELRRQCSRMLWGFHDTQPAETMEAIALWCRQNETRNDNYGEGRIIAELETKVAALVGKPAAAFFPSGVMAQLSALRIWTEEKRLPRFAMHTSSHLEQHEERAYQAVFGLQSAFLGEPHRIVLAKDIEALREPVACALVELPMREIGGQLPTWEQLEEIKQATRQRGIRLHMDGARLWESRAYYGRGYDAISEGFDSVYVSLYKGLGAISGAVLAGDRDFVATAKLWRRRLGGTLVCQTAVLVSALMQLELRLSMMDRLYQRALALAEGLNTIPGIRTLPLVPQSNMMHIYFDAAPESVLDSRDDIAARAGLWLLSYVDPTVTGTGSSTELYVGDRLLDLTNDEVLPSIAELVAPR